MDTNPAHWTPNDWLRLVALVGAFALFGLGAWMLFQGISAEGQVDLKSTVLSGTIKATSAGLYICFFALFIIVFVLVTLLGLSKHEPQRVVGRAHRLKPIFWGLLAALVACGIGVAFLPESFRSFGGMAFGFLSLSLVSVILSYIRMAHDDDA